MGLQFEAFLGRGMEGSTVFAFAAGFLSIVAAVLYSFGEATYRAFLRTGIPKVRTLFPFGSWFGIWGKVIGEYDLENVRAYGKLYWSFDGKKGNVFVSDADSVMTVLNDKSNSFQSFRAEKVQEQMLVNCLKAIEKSEYSKEDSVFNQASMNKLIPRIERVAESLIQKLKNKGGSIHAQQIFMQFIGDIIAMIVFGIDIYSDEFQGQHPEFMESINQVFFASNPTSVSSILPYIWSGGYLDDSILPNKAVTFFSKLCMSVLEKKRQLANNLQTLSGDVDIIDIILESQKEKTLSKEADSLTKEEGINDADLIIKCLSIIVYTVRATENSLSEAVYILSNMEDEQVKLYEEIKNFVDGKGDKSGSKCIDAEYLDMFIKELQRMYPIEYRLVRNCNEGTTIGDHKLPPNISLTIPIYAIHHLPEYYPEPFSFRPDRFSFENKKSIQKSTYFPYGNATTNPDFVGCKLVELITKMTMAHMLMNFKILLPVPHFQAPLHYSKGATEVPVLMPVMFQVEKRS